MNVSMAQVFKAVDYANSHPDKYLNGTTNWCAAVAFDLNRQANAAPQPPALGGEHETFEAQAKLSRLQAEIERLKAESEWRRKMAESNCAEHDKLLVVVRDLRLERDQLKARCDELESRAADLLTGLETVPLVHSMRFRARKLEAALSKPAGSVKP